jgi:hypothetical protein
LRFRVGVKLRHVQERTRESIREWHVLLGGEEPEFGLGLGRRLQLRGLRR